MKKKFLKKKGVSPLIATVLLISFAVALGAVVMNWGRNIEIINPVDKCSGVDLTVRKTIKEICFGGTTEDSYINFILDNTGSIDVEGVLIYIIGSKKTKFHDIDNKINKGELLDIKDKSISYDFDTFGNIKQVQFTPKIFLDDSIEICHKNVISADKIDVCG